MHNANQVDQTGDSQYKAGKTPAIYKINFYTPDNRDGVQQHYVTHLTVADLQDNSQVVYEASEFKDLSNEELHDIDTFELDLNTVEDALLAKLIYEMPREFIKGADGVFFDFGELWEELFDKRFLREIGRRYGYIMHHKRIMTLQKVEQARSLAEGGASAEEVAKAMGVVTATICSYFPEFYGRKAKSADNPPADHT